MSGGDNNRAEQALSTVIGGSQGKTNYNGEVVHATGSFGAQGDAQNSFLVLRKSVTVGAAAVELTCDGTGVSSTNTITLSNNSMLQFIVKVAARDTLSAGNFAWWHIIGGIKRDATDVTTSLVGVNTVTTGSLGANAATWTCVVQADATGGRGSLQILVSAPSGTGPVRFVASVYLTRVA